MSYFCRILIMKRYISFIIFSLSIFSIYAQGRLREDISRDATGKLIYKASDNFRAELSKDIFDNLVYKDNRNNTISYSKEIYPVLLDNFRDEYQLMYSLVDEMSGLMNNREKYSYDILGKLLYEDNKGMRASLSTDVLEKKIFRDSNNNEIIYSKDNWNKILADFDNREFDVFLWLMDYCRGQNALKEKNETDIFGTTKHTTNSAKGNNSYGRDVFGNLKYTQDDFKASIETNIFDDKLYKDSNGNEIKYEKKFIDFLAYRGIRLDDERLLLELLHFCEKKRNYKESYQVDIFDSLKYSNSDGKKISIDKEIAGNIRIHGNADTMFIRKYIFEGRHIERY